MMTILSQTPFVSTRLPISWIACGDMLPHDKRQYICNLVQVLMDPCRPYLDSEKSPLELKQYDWRINAFEIAWGKPSTFCLLIKQNI